MSLKVINTEIREDFHFSQPDKNGIRTAEEPFFFKTDVLIDGVQGRLDFIILKGCKYNGASNPLGWPIKNYYDDPKLDCCGLGHDILYACGGEVVGLERTLSAGECDDFIRGAMRCAGFNRKQAGIVDWFVRHLAHFRHFGKKHDKEGMHENSSVVWMPYV